MRPRNFLILLAVTLLVGTAAVWSYLAQRPDDALRLEGAPVLPGLEDRLSDVARVEVVTPAGGYTLARRGDGWVAASKYGYPVKAARVHRTLIALTKLERLAPKTRMPERYRRLGVGDPEAEGAQSRLLRLRDADGDVLAALIVGKQRLSRTGQADAGTYVRRPGRDRAWLAAGLLDLTDEVYPWLDTLVVDIPPGELERIELRPRGRPRLLAVRPAPDAEALALADVPPGRQPDVAKVRRLGAVLSAVKFDDVRPDDRVTFFNPAARATIATFDGVVLEIEVARRDGDTWIRLDASAAADASAAGRARAQQIAAQVDGWAYKVAAYIGERLSHSLEDVLKPSA